jgi:hypothetical protein
MLRTATLTITLSVILGLLFGAEPTLAQKTDTGSIFDKSGGKQPGTIDVKIDTSLPSPPPSVPGRPVESSTGTSSGSAIEKSSGTSSSSSSSSDKSGAGSTVKKK